MRRAIPGLLEWTFVIACGLAGGALLAGVLGASLDYRSLSVPGIIAGGVIGACLLSPLRRLLRRLLSLELVRYEKVIVRSDDDVDQPTTIYLELDDNGREVRKVEQYRDGRLGFAGRAGRARSTGLDKMSWPTHQQIAEIPEFTAQQLSAEEFEAVWNQATGSQ